MKAEFSAAVFLYATAWCGYCCPQRGRRSGSPFRRSALHPPCNGSPMRQNRLSQAPFSRPSPSAPQSARPPRSLRPPRSFCNPSLTKENSPGSRPAHPPAPSQRPARENPSYRRKLCRGKYSPPHSAFPPC